MDQVIERYMFVREARRLAPEAFAACFREWTPEQMARMAAKLARWGEGRQPKRATFVAGRRS